MLIKSWSRFIAAIRLNPDNAQRINRCQVRLFLTNV